MIIDGTKLPPICIFKGKNIPREEKVPSGVIAWFQPSGWMDANLMQKYVDYIDNIRKTNGIRTSAMMVYDSFRGHLEEQVKKKFKESGFHLAVIPGGLTSICQPLDIAINKPFKDNLRREWHTWMGNGGAGLTDAGNLRRAKISDVCGWVKRSWDNVAKEIIIESFEKCGISKTLNNSDDSDSDFELDITDSDNSDTGSDSDGTNSTDNDTDGIGSDSD